MTRKPYKIGQTTDETVWHSDLRRMGDESFAAYLERNADILPDVDPRAIEQWLFKHWVASPFRHISLDGLVSRTERWDTDRIISIGVQPSNRIEPGTAIPNHWLNTTFPESREPGKTMRATGTWNFPILILENEPGYDLGPNISRHPDPDTKFWLIEGHQRFYLLQVLSLTNKAAAQHEVIVISKPGGL